MNSIDTELEALYVTDKYVNDLNWRAMAPGRYRLEADVFTDTETLRLSGNYSQNSVKKPGYSFSLLHQNCLTVRRWDFGPHHGKKSYSHKHKENYESYPVDDISLENVNQALLDFLKECNIDLRGQYQAII